MQKWEYLQLEYFYERDERRYAMNGQFKHDWNGEPIHKVLNLLGEDGWELISFDRSARELMFKRVKAT